MEGQAEPVTVPAGTRQLDVGIFKVRRTADR